MALNTSSADNRNSDDKHKDATTYIDMLFPYFEMYDDFQLHKLIGNFSKEPELYKKMIDTQPEIYRQLNINKYVQPGTYNTQLRLSPKGREAKSKGGHFAYIKSEEEKLKKLNEKEDIQYDLLKTDLRKANLEIQHLADSVSDYYDNKWKSNWSFVISIITVVIALAALIVSIVK